MKTLHNHVILYDAECPMCNLYTGAFVRSGMLGADGRESYQQFTGAACPNLDWQRAVNEIALINRATGEVSYGIESLLKVCANASPALGFLFRWKPMLWLARKAYAFISYNRRVIVPAPVSVDSFGFQPTFKIQYRLAWLLFTWALTAYILTAYTKLLNGYIPSGEAWREYLICGGQILFQGAVIFAYRRRVAWDYLGNMMTVSLAGALVLYALLIIGVWLKLSFMTYGLCVMPVVFLMLLEHLRRCKLLGLGYLMSASWVFYRLIVLAILLKGI
ncbi:DUF393 domain-containing protein [Dyadobacter sp. CY261]|uniref:DUF393 domain-containing protein n=1 Tax=Dyadobacter sp. CY261 TaxID=2907203 RepID=UPI001F383DD9|nr:DUF393 domain-containing protein [Dyadobacter sp. CY261]MCF0069289.1 DUF393 domain-containing protein [Dyadobacter sp. CY261]